MKKLLAFVIISSILIMTLFSFYVKNTYESLPNLKNVNTSKIRVSYDASEYSQYIYDENISYDTLKENSDLIVEVKCVDYGQQHAYSILRKCQIKKVIYGAYTDDYLYVYEPSYFLPHDEISIVNGYINMHNDKVYLLFLKKVNAPKNVNEIYSKGYYLTSATFGKYEYNNYAKLMVYNYDSDTYYNKINNKCVMIIDKKEAELYNKILTEAYKYKRDS